jgi:hypothetical protein
LQVFDGRAAPTASAAPGGQNATNPESVGRKQINVRIDHNFNTRHRIGVGWTLQRDSNDDNLPSWPGGFFGKSLRRPQVLTANFTSTLSASLVNEVRYGVSYQATTSILRGWSTTRTSARMLRRTFSKAVKVLQAVRILWRSLPAQAIFRLPKTSSTKGSTFSGSSSPLLNYADTLSYSRGKHAFRMARIYVHTLRLVLPARWFRPHPEARAAIHRAGKRDCRAPESIGEHPHERCEHVVSPRRFSEHREHVLLGSKSG